MHITYRRRYTKKSNEMSYIYIYIYVCICGAYTVADTLNKVTKCHIYIYIYIYAAQIPAHIPKINISDRMFICFV